MLTRGKQPHLRRHSHLTETKNNLLAKEILRNLKFKDTL